ncbi:hypothetical protein Pst134EA_015839 [Puccinia striiformis f. sp. tritici]|uniref:hypothetical protein n=1 Tax=Puccinia striiformis f. sp. tritici TaxID=168172 RepID=UPI00200827AF|nr:hypothetical protein Pst134EA_015839 [Puccinia striiformis f. sp. tritici]KAH9463755.1 hypothetical protein Pst134EA_015839 [Puccinia striiformis f. sp. tritici]
MICIGQTLQGQYQQLDAMCRMNAQGPHHQLQEDEEMGSNSDRLQKSRISLVRNFSKTLLSSSQSSTETLGSINKS